MPKAQKSKSGSAATGPYSTNKTGSSTNKVFKFNTTLGQHILKNPGVATAIVEKASLKPSDIVLEVGPGTGNLTVQILAKSVRQLHVVEMDPRMAAELTKRVQGTPEWEKKLQITVGDVIKAPLPYFDVCISNTPYQISSPLVFKLLQASPPPRVAVLMFQREFAMRLVAKPGEPLYCRLSANVQMWAKVAHVLKVGKNNFRPPPKVESSVVRIEPKNPRPTVSYEEWDGMLRILFVRGNRTIKSAFASRAVMEMVEKNWTTWRALQDTDMEMDDKGQNLEKVKTIVEKVLNETGMAEKRATKCGEQDFLKLLYAFNTNGIHFR
ncbi:rRNA adenine dimethylase [Ascodesmis nigricans]|uniref:rRNA adenine N(6)-methyltransferase n=1 Tax=Ascodesmis nigricans TaxID=341454 RepID=A0A4S2N8B2_9PEZI|nr:rRNA adenine dimethylase [Ascodesmis nigricans]